MRAIRIMGSTCAPAARGAGVPRRTNDRRHAAGPLPVRGDRVANPVLRSALVASRRSSTCPYEGQALYWSLHVGERTARDAVWSYRDPLRSTPS